MADREQRQAARAGCSFLVLGLRDPGRKTKAGLSFLRRVKNIQYFDNAFSDTVWNHIRRNNHFAGQGYPARSATIWELRQSLATLPNSLSLGKHHLGIGCFLQKDTNPFQVSDGIGGPSDFSQAQRSTPIWQMPLGLRFSKQTFPHRPEPGFHESVQLAKPALQENVPMPGPQEKTYSVLWFGPIG